MTSVYLGIDPGANGGMAALLPSGKLVTAALSKMTWRDVWEWLHNHSSKSCRGCDNKGTVCIGFGGKHGFGPPTPCPMCKGTSNASRPFAIIEKVGGYVSGTGFKAGSSAMFNFGYGAGALEAFVIAAAIPYELVTPQMWQRALGIPPRRRAVRGRTTTSDGKPPETESQWKGRLRAKAQSLFPLVKVTLPIADAILLSEFNRRSQASRNLDRK